MLEGAVECSSRGRRGLGERRAAGEAEARALRVLLPQFGQDDHAASVRTRHGAGSTPVAAAWLRRDMDEARSVLRRLERIEATRPGAAHRCPS